MDIEENEYIRTQHGISKVIKVLHNRVFVDNLGFAILKTDIVNHRKNKIDLINVGDYVNGYKILEIHEALAPDDERILDIGYGMAIFNDSIESIVTKEQFASVEYVF